jgi:hypothetical protein
MRIATASQVDGPGWRITWKQAKDREVVNYKSIAEGLLATLSEEDRLALVGIHTNTTPGSRPFVLRERER